MNEEQNIGDGNDFFDDDTPWADASIRKEYEAALGSCILAFNQIDNILGKIIKGILAQIDRKDLFSECVNKANFAQRVTYLDLLRHSAGGECASNIHIDKLRSISGERNLLAHAHFEQNPFDGSYDLVNRKDSVDQCYTSERINNLTIQMMEVWHELRYAETYHMFRDVTVVPPPTMPDE